MYVLLIWGGKIIDTKLTIYYYLSREIRKIEGIVNLRSRHTSWLVGSVSQQNGVQAEAEIEAV